MYCRGEYTTDGVTYGVIVNHTKHETEAVLVLSGTVISAYRVNQEGSFSYNNNKAKDMVQAIQTGIRSSTAKNGVATPFKLGAMTQHEFVKAKVSYIIQLHKGELAGAFIESDKIKIEVEYNENVSIPANIPYVKLSSVKKDLDVAEDDLGAIPVRSVQEIALEKEDLTWLQNKKYYIVNDDETAEKIFQFLDSYNGIISYDTETTGLKINCFGKIGSKYKEELDKYNEEHPDEKIRADRLVGIIFCVEEDISYYFPCFNRKFKNLYEDKNSVLRKRIITNTKARYTVGDRSQGDSDMRGYVLNTPEDEWGLDVILMERVRDILEKHHLTAHNGSFEWKVGWQYEIDTNICDDSMIMHKLMFKFRSTTSNRGEPSDLKYLAKHELGIDQWELKDFFPNWKEDKKGLVREKPGEKKGTRIDFSYMDYAGTQIYAPTDGDVTLCLTKKYKQAMITEHRDMEYLYSIELIVSLAVAYMEFYGHRIDESKIFNARLQTQANLVMLESEIRQSINYANMDEITHYNELKEVRDRYKNEKDADMIKSLEEEIISLCDKIKSDIANNTDNVLNLSAPGQVADLLFNKLGYPLQGDKPSVAKKVIKALLKDKNEDGSPKYPVAVLYSKYKNEETLMVKFFDNLVYFMYPGGFIFSSYGQIAAATGRMSCSKPNAQQYPKVITKIVIPRDGYVMADADYSQIEYRVLTALAKNDGLAKLFSDPDSDYHTLMASLMYEVPYASVTSAMRSAAKSFNFGIPYGMGLGSLAILLTGKNTPQTRDEAAEKYEAYFKNQPKTRKFFENVKEMAQINKYTKTLFNRYRYYSFTDKDGKENNAKKAAALREAGNAVIQGTAADIFKIGVARNFNYIRKNKLFGKLLIVNMIHDEQLLEIDTKSLNVQRVLTDVGKNMQFEIEGFPPLYIGAGIGPAWGYAKGKMAEIHPNLLDELTNEAQSTPIFKETVDETADTKSVLDYFQNRVYEFRRKKVADYLVNSENWHKDIHPAIGGLINLQFNFGRGDDAKAYVGPNGEKYSDAEFLNLNISDFIKENNLPVETSWFSANDTITEMNVEEDKEYSDDEEEDTELDEIGSAEMTSFSTVDDSNNLFGSSVHDLIGIFKACILEGQRICGIEVKDMYYKKKDAIIDFLMQYVCNEDEPGAMQIVFLTDANVLKYTGIYVAGLTSSALEKKYKEIMSGKVGTGSNYNEGDIHTRSQAK